MSQDALTPTQTFFVCRLHAGFRLDFVFWLGTTDFYRLEFPFIPFDAGRRWVLPLPAFSLGTTDTNSYRFILIQIPFWWDTDTIPFILGWCSGRYHCITRYHQVIPAPAPPPDSGYHSLPFHWVFDGRPPGGFCSVFTCIHYSLHHLTTWVHTTCSFLGGGTISTTTVMPTCSAILGHLGGDFTGAFLPFLIPFWSIRFLFHSILFIRWNFHSIHFWRCHFYCSFCSGILPFIPLVDTILQFYHSFSIRCSYIHSVLGDDHSGGDTFRYHFWEVIDPTILILLPLHFIRCSGGPFHSVATVPVLPFYHSFVGDGSVPFSFYHLFILPFPTGGSTISFILMGRGSSTDFYHRASRCRSTILVLIVQIRPRSFLPSVSGSHLGSHSSPPFIHSTMGGFRTTCSTVTTDFYHHSRCILPFGPISVFWEWCTITSTFYLPPPPFDTIRLPMGSFVSTISIFHSGGWWYISFWLPFWVWGWIDSIHSFILHSIQMNQTSHSFCSIHFIPFHSTITNFIHCSWRRYHSFFLMEAILPVHFRFHFPLFIGGGFYRGGSLPPAYWRRLGWVFWFWYRIPFILISIVVPFVPTVRGHQCRSGSVRFLHSISPVHSVLTSPHVTFLDFLPPDAFYHFTILDTILLPFGSFYHFCSVRFILPFDAF